MITILGHFFRLVEVKEINDLIQPISTNYLLNVIHSFQKDKSPRLNGWTMWFNANSFELVGEDFLKSCGVGSSV